MTVINFQTLEHLNVRSSKDLTQPAGSSECGAYALAAAVGAFHNNLDQEQICYEDEGPQKVKRKASLKGATSFKEKCKAIYQVTGILNDSPPPDLKTKNTDNDSGNSLAAMARVAIQMGMAVPELYGQEQALKELTNIYEHAVARCIRAVGESNIHRQAGNYHPPSDSQTHLLLARRNRTDKLVMHWVAQGSDESFYDPANGSIDNRWAPLKFGDPMGKEFLFMGIWIVISR